MTEDQDPTIWTPPETIDTNTQRMAWQLFIESFKHALSANKAFPEQVARVYNECLTAAKIVREAEIKAGGS